MPAGSARILADILASGPIRPGHQHSTATHVEGREAPRREGGHGFTPTPGVVPCESFRDARAGGPGALYFCDVHIEDPACWHCGAARSKHGPDIEACARAAYEASGRHDPAVLPWDLLGDDLQDRAREVARAVLAAAARGAK